jgi:preprotein translocase subunit YajC
MARFKKGDEVRTKDGQTGRVIKVNKPGTKSLGDTVYDVELDDGDIISVALRSLQASRRRKATVSLERRSRAVALARKQGLIQPVQLRGSPS